MSTKPIASALLGPETENLLERETSRFLELVQPLDDDGWDRGIARLDATIGAVVLHLAEGAEELSETWEERDSRAGETLFQPFHREGGVESVAHPDSREETIARYERAANRVNKALGEVGLDDWAWPSRSPLGGVETLAEAARRCVAHHYVHRHDVLDALDREIDPHEETIQLLIEAILDTIARRGAKVIDPPMAFEVVTVEPGAGAWALVFDPPEEVERDQFDVWKRLLRWEPDDLPAHRIERGRPDAPRATVRASGDVFWRAAFGRGPHWDQLDLHGDDQGIEAWKRLVGHVV